MRQWLPKERRQDRLHSDSPGPQKAVGKQKKAGEEGAIGGGISQQGQAESKSHRAEDKDRVMCDVHRPWALLPLWALSSIKCIRNYFL